MDNGTKIALAFLGGAVAGAAALALLNRGKIDLEYLKPLATEWINKGMDLKDTLIARVDAMKENMEQMASESRSQAEARKTIVDPEAPNQDA